MELANTMEQAGNQYLFEFDYVDPNSLTLNDVCKMLPEYTEEDYAELLRDVGTYGIKTPIEVLKGTNEIIDGRHRWRAAIESLVEAVPVVYVEPNRESLKFFVLSMEKYRRHLTKSQIAAIYAEYALKVKEENNQKGNENLRNNSGSLGLDSTVQSEENLNETENLSTVAEKIGVGVTTLKDAATIAEFGDEEDKQAVKEGKASVEKVAKKVREKKKAAKKTMNESTGDGIEWAAYSWNPMTGCEHTCEYCYARDLATSSRMAANFPKGFAYHFRQDRLDMPMNTKKKKSLNNRVFMGSMTDFWGKWVPLSDQKAVLSVIEQNPQWEFLSLTKDIWNVMKRDVVIPKNMWIGATVDNIKVLKRTVKELRVIKEKHGCIVFISFEPMFEDMSVGDFSGIDWVIYGGASVSSKTPEYIPPFKHVANMYFRCKELGVKQYMKANMDMGKKIRVVEFPR